MGRCQVLCLTLMISFSRHCMRVPRHKGVNFSRVTAGLHAITWIHIMRLKPQSWFYSSYFLNARTYWDSNLLVSCRHALPPPPSCPSQMMFLRISGVLEMGKDGYYIVSTLCPVVMPTVTPLFT